MNIEEAWEIIKNMVNLEYTASTYDKALVVIEQALRELRRLQGKQNENDDELIDACKNCEKYMGWGIE